MREGRPSLVVVSLVLALAAVPVASAQTADNVAVVVNDESDASRRIGEYYVKKRGVPAGNVIRLRTSTDETIERNVFESTIQQPVGAALARGGMQDRILYIVLTKGVPLRVNGTGGADGTVSSVDSELSLLYRRMAGDSPFVRGRIDNPYFLGERSPEEIRPFTRRDHDIYLVTRLDAFTVEEALALVDRGSAPVREGRVVLDQQDRLSNRTGEEWLARAAERLTVAGEGERVVLENTVKPARGVEPVLGYYSWGSTDPRNRVRRFEMRFVAGALAATFVSTDARTFREPPASWVPTETRNKAQWFGGSAQSLIGDLIREGVTGAAGHVAEPYLQSAVRPEILFPAYLSGLNLAEAFYAAMPHLSWQTVVIGDPLCAPFRRTAVARGDIDGGADPATSLPTFFSARRLASLTRTSPGLPERALVLSLRAEALLARDDRPAAQASLREALEVAPRFVGALVRLSAMAEQDKEYGEAIDAYRRILDIEPNHLLALNNLAYALAVHENNPADALPLARRAVAQSPNDPTVLDTLGWVYHLLGDHKNAVPVMQQAARANPRIAEIRLHAAIVFEAAGARAVAESELAQALKLNPALEKSPEVETLRTRLQQRTAPD